MVISLFFSVALAAPPLNPVRCPEVPPTKELCAIEAVSTLSQRTVATAQAVSFNFENKFDCSKLSVDPGDRTTRVFCAEEKPKSWSSNERILIEKAMALVMSHSKLRKALLDLAKGGAIRFFRVKNSVSHGDHGKKEVTKAASAFYDAQKGGITFQDFYSAT
jgi:hypothetical protein